MVTIINEAEFLFPRENSGGKISRLLRYKIFCNLEAASYYFLVSASQIILVAV